MVRRWAEWKAVIWLSAPVVLLDEVLKWVSRNVLESRRQPGARSAARQAGRLLQQNLNKLAPGSGSASARRKFGMPLMATLQRVAPPPNLPPPPPGPFPPLPTIPSSFFNCLLPVPPSVQVQASAEAARLAGIAM